MVIFLGVFWGLLEGVFFIFLRNDLKVWIYILKKSFFFNEVLFKRVKVFRFLVVIFVILLFGENNKFLKFCIILEKLLIIGNFFFGKLWLENLLFILKVIVFFDIFIFFIFFLLVSFTFLYVLYWRIDCFLLFL